MAELAPRERLQPSLLDRLTDDEPDKQTESRDKRVLSMQRLREAVRRDLGWLFNTCHLAATCDLDPYPQVASSVLNFGIPDLAGRTSADIDIRSVEGMLRQAILHFEPRILPDTLSVRVVVDEDSMAHNAMVFDIEGQLWADPAPMYLFLKTELDFELGDVRIRDESGRG